MPESTVHTFPPGVVNPYGTYITLYNQHRMGEMYSDPKKDYSVRGGGGNSPKQATKETKKGY